jgi:hypothetical protein
MQENIPTECKRVHSILVVVSGRSMGLRRGAGQIGKSATPHWRNGTDPRKDDAL